MHRRLIPMLMVLFLGSSVAWGSIVDGYAFLEGASDHTGVKVEILTGDFPHAPSYTDEYGHFDGWLAILGGRNHTFKYSYPGYQTQYITEWIPLLSDVRLDDVTLPEPPPPPDYDHTIQWDQRWSDGNWSGGSRVAVDSQNNVVVGGINDAEWGMLLKYDQDGDLLWNTPIGSFPESIDISTEIDLGELGVVTSSQLYHVQQALGEYSIMMLMDVAVDSEDNIITVGTLFDEDFEETHTKIAVAKYDPNGYPMWYRTYQFLSDSATMGMGCDVDSNDNIYLAGGIMNEDPLVATGLVMKLSASGQTLWIKPRIGIRPTIYSDIAVDSNDDVYATGFIISLVFSGDILIDKKVAGDYTLQASAHPRSPMGLSASGPAQKVSYQESLSVERRLPSAEVVMKLLVTKYGQYVGLKLDEKVIGQGTNNLMSMAIAVDQNDNDFVYTVGGGDQGGFIAKLGSGLQQIWFVDHGWVFTGVDFMMDTLDCSECGDNIALSGAADSDGYYGAVFNKDTGGNLLDMDLGPREGGGFFGLDDYMKGCAVDLVGDLLVTGGRGAVVTVKTQVAFD